MAKKSAIENNLRKQRLAKKFAGRRQRLLAHVPGSPAGPPEATDGTVLTGVSGSTNGQAVTWS